jgi:hypothetical protein
MRVLNLNLCLCFVIAGVCDVACGVGLRPLAAVEGPDSAVHLAVTIIHEQARNLQGLGQSTIAAQLESLAGNLERGQVTLSDAALVVQIAMAGQQVRTVALSGVPPISATQAVDILDGSAHAPAPVPQPASVTVTATQPATAAPATTARPVATQPPAAPSAPAGPIATVMALATGPDGSASLVMIKVGPHHVVKGEHLQVRRGDAAVSIIHVDDTMGDMAACSVVFDKANLPLKEDDQVFATDK